MSYPDNTRAEHLTWCKGRALEYVAAGDLHNAVSSMTSDLNKHPATAGDPSLKAHRLRGMGLLLEKEPADQIRAWITAFD